MSSLTLHYTSIHGSVHDWCLVLCDPGQVTKAHLLNLISSEYRENTEMVKELLGGVMGDKLTRLSEIVKDWVDEKEDATQAKESEIVNVKIEESEPVDENLERNRFSNEGSLSNNERSEVEINNECENITQTKENETVLIKTEETVNDDQEENAEPNETSCNSLSASDFSSDSFHQSSAKQEKTKITCDKCFRQFSHKGNLVTHQRSVHGKETFPCNKCDHQATQKTSLMRHIESVHLGVTHACESCPQIYKWKIDLIRHKQSIHDGLRFKCGSCEKEFSKKSCLNIHKYAVHEQRKHQCGSCDYQATTKSALSIHMNSLHEGIRYPCGNCDYQATQKGDLSRHSNQCMKRKESM